MFGSKKRQLRELLTQFGKPKQYVSLYYQKHLYEVDPKQTGIDNLTASDLDLDSTYRYLDRCTSVIGQQCLYRRLRHAAANEFSRDDYEKYITSFTQDDIAGILPLLSTFETDRDYVYPTIIYQNVPELGPYRNYARITLWLGFATLLFGIIYPLLWLLLIPILVGNLIVHYRVKTQMGHFAGVFGRLARLQGVGDRLIPLSHLSPSEVRRLGRDLKTLKRFNRSFQIIRLDRLGESEATSVGWYLLEIVKFVTLLDVLIYANVLHKIETIKSSVASVYFAIGELDIALSIQGLRRQCPRYCVPRFESTYGYAVTGLIHPLIAEAVPNDFTFNKRGALITGSNMAGKSSFIKAVGLSAICAQALNTVFAGSYRACRWRVTSCINVIDSLEEGTSYYMQEVYRIGRILRAAADDLPCLVILDELFQGTNTLERVAAAKAILTYLVQRLNMVLVATHDIELGELLAADYDLFHFQESVRDEQPVFDYTLKSGLLTQSNALEILRVSGYPASVIAEAHSIVRQLRNGSTV